MRYKNKLTNIYFYSAKEVIKSINNQKIIIYSNKEIKTGITIRFPNLKIIKNNLESHVYCDENIINFRQQYKFIGESDNCMDYYYTIVEFDEINNTIIVFCPISHKLYCCGGKILLNEFNINFSDLSDIPSSYDTMKYWNNIEFWKLSFIKKNDFIKGLTILT